MPGGAVNDVMHLCCHVIVIDMQCVGQYAMTRQCYTKRRLIDRGSGGGQGAARAHWYDVTNIVTTDRISRGETGERPECDRPTGLC